MGNVGEIEEKQWLSSSNTKLPLLSLNHVSFVCKSVSRSVRFYEQVLGFVLIKRPSSFRFEGAWLFNYGIGIHLLESQSVPTKKERINPKDNHISFQCSDMKQVMRKLEEMEIQYVTAVVEEGGIQVDQLFFHDPDGYMVEICNCQNLPVLPLVSCPLNLNLNLNLPNPIPTTTTNKPLSSLHGTFNAQILLFITPCRNREGKQGDKLFWNGGSDDGKFGGGLIRHINLTGNFVARNLISEKNMFLFEA